MNFVVQAPLFLTIFYIINVCQDNSARVIIPTIVSLVSTFAILQGSRLRAVRHIDFIRKNQDLIDTLALSINYSCLMALYWSTKNADSVIPFLILASLCQANDKFQSPLRICTSLFHLALAILILIISIEKIPVLHVYSLCFVAFAPVLEILPNLSGKPKILPATNASKLSLAEKGILSKPDSVPSMIPEKIPSYLKKQQVMVEALKKKTSYPLARRTSNDGGGQMKITSDPKNSLLFRHSSLVESAAHSDLGIIQEQQVITTEKKHHYTTTIPLGGSSSTNPATEIIQPIIQDLMDQTRDPSVLQALANVLEMLNLMAVDAETILDRNMKEMLEKSNDPELKVLEWGLQLVKVTIKLLTIGISGTGIQSKGQIIKCCWYE